MEGPSLITACALKLDEMTGAKDPKSDPSGLKGYVSQAWNQADREGGSQAGGTKLRLG